MKIGTISVYLAINFISLSLQNELEIIEKVDEIEEPKTLDGAPIEEEIPFNKNFHKTPVEKFSDEQDLDDPEAKLKKHSKLTKKVHHAESKGNKVEREKRRRNSKVAVDFDDDYIMKGFNKEELNDVKRKKKLPPINEDPHSDEFFVKPKVNSRKLFRNSGLFL